MDKTEGEKGLFISADNLLQCNHNMGCDKNRIQCKMRGRCMSALTSNCYIYFISTCHGRPASKTKFSNFQAWMNMQSEDSLWSWIVKDTFFNQQTGTTRILFFSWLKNEFYSSLPILISVPVIFWKRPGVYWYVRHGRRHA